MNILKDKEYLKIEENFFKKHKNLVDLYFRKLLYLQKDIHHPSLRLHKIYGEHNNRFSISLDKRYRILIDLIEGTEDVFLVNIGTHQDVY